ncbi:MAG: metallophosphoesterase, partial [Alphaproteobacteria bacterium]|nr:metallophosphoesterase [Alphaproteobacteria bacterium]
GEATFCGVAAEIGPDGLAAMIAPVRLGGRLREEWPKEWGAP